MGEAGKNVACMVIMKQMVSTNALSAAPRALDWLNTTRVARPLHIFDQVINLVNQDARVLSVVSIVVGNGPFSLLVGEDGFRELVTVQSLVSIEQNSLVAGELSVDFSQASPWDPRPQWGSLTQSQFQTLKQSVRAGLLSAGQDQNFPRVFGSTSGIVPFNSPFSRTAALAVEQIRKGFQLADWKAVLQGAADLTGLGVGLTPAGDDFLVGMMHGLWARAADQVEELCAAIAQTAIPRTNTLSAAWLEAASQGEAAQVWHDLLSALQANQINGVRAAVQTILRTGETSGVDALTGFYFILNQEQFL